MTHTHNDTHTHNETHTHTMTHTHTHNDTDTHNDTHTHTQSVLHHSRKKNSIGGRRSQSWLEIRTKRGFLLLSSSGELMPLPA